MQKSGGNMRCADGIFAEGNADIRENLLRIRQGQLLPKRKIYAGEKFLRSNNTYRVNLAKEGSYEKGYLERLEG